MDYGEQLRAGDVVSVQLDLDVGTLRYAVGSDWGLPSVADSGAKSSSSHLAGVDFEQHPLSSHCSYYDFRVVDNLTSAVAAPPQALVAVVL